MKKLFFKAMFMSFIMAFQLSFAQKTVSGTVTDDKFCSSSGGNDCR